MIIYDIRLSQWHYVKYGGNKNAFSNTGCNNHVIKKTHTINSQLISNHNFSQQVSETFQHQFKYDSFSKVPFFSGFACMLCFFIDIQNIM